MNWLEIKIKTENNSDEEVLGYIYKQGIQGVSIQDPKDILDIKEDLEGIELFDDSLLNIEEKNIIITFYLPESEKSQKKVEEIEKDLQDKDYILEFNVNIIQDRDWGENWKKHYKPIKVGENIIIKPSWEDYTQFDSKEIVIELDPGMAFGTGTHETTELCIRELEQLVKSQDIVYDIGCGSGILSIVAAKMGASKVIGVDIDELAIRASNENVRINHVEDKVKIFEGNLLDKIDGKANIIVSNILADIIVDMIPDLKLHLHNDSIFIASGIILDKEDLVVRALEDNCFNVLDIKHKGEWSVIIAKN